MTQIDHQHIILGTGLNGLVGSKLVAQLKDTYNWVNLDVNDPVQPVDITKLDQVQRVVSSTQAQYLVHFAAFTDVTKAWEQQGQKDGPAYQVNVVGTQNMVHACAEAGKHLIHISTAYVFDGEKAQPYTEEDVPKPIEWYGETKWLAEQAVTQSSDNWTILRIDQPFRSDPFPRLDLVHRIAKQLQEGTLPPQFTNHTFGPTFIDDFVKVIEWVVRTGTTGLFHATAGESWTDFEFAKMVQETHHLGGELKPGDVEAYLKTVSRPYQRNTALNTSKLTAVFDGKSSSIREAVGRVKFA